jgi:hypothetical protein
MNFLQSRLHWYNKQKKFIYQELFKGFYNNKLKQESSCTNINEETNPQQK